MADMTTLTGEILEYAPTRKAPMTKSTIPLGTNWNTGQDFALGIGIVTDSTAVLGRRGSGKTTTCRKIMEGVAAAGVQFVVADPLDAWWGLRSSADGKGKGLSVYIFGGEHADLPINEASASLIADLVVDKGISAVLVLDEMKKAGQRRFMAKFIERLFERKRPQEHRTPLLVMLDEADVFAPQKPMTPESISSLHEVDTLVRQGRSRGLGSIVCSQRPQVLNKDVLSQTEMVVCMQLTTPQDRKAMKDWTDANATESEAKQFSETLPALDKGVGWVWSPSVLKCFVLVKMALPFTYDSSRTPQIDEKPRPAAKLLPVDVNSITAAMSKTIEDAKANDPKALKARVAQLQAELAKKVPPAPSSMTQKQIDDITKAALAERDKSWQTTLQASLKARDEHWLLNLDKIVKWESAQFSVRVTTEVERIAKQLSGAKLPQMAPTQQQPIGSFHMGPGNNPKPPPPEVTKRIVDSLTEGMNKHVAEASGGEMSGPLRKILTVLAQHYDHHSSHPSDQPAMPNERVAIRAGYSYSGGFRNYLSDLRGRGWIQNEAGGICITEVGRRALGTFEAMPTGSGLLEWWKQRVSNPEAKILTCLDNQLSGYSGPDLAAAAGYEYSGGFRNYISSLRTKGLIEGRGKELITLHEDLT